ncbi:TlpA family protein disulfide reductase [Pedobacter sp. MW01-1-1]|uniref:TlpA family protein disulfide reductase n=1 Tax=Pedobacter sp. MW01-1-1 TaxID=3383027 RepID=UPI003FF03086
MKFKKLSAAVLLTAATLSSFAQLPVEIKGAVQNAKREVKLFKVEDGKSVQIATNQPTQKGKFGFLFYPEYEGLYVVGMGNELSPTDNYKFYFKGGEKLSLSILDSSYVLTGKENSKENIVLTQWHDLTNPLEQKAINFMKNHSTFVDYFPIQEEIVAKSKSFLKGKATGNAKFDKAMADYMQMDLINYATNFLNTPRTAHPSVEEYSNFYSTLRAENIAKTTRLVYTYPYGLRALSGLINVNIRQDGKKYLRGVAGVDLTTSYVPNDTLKGDIVLDNAAIYRTITDYDELMQKYGKYVLTESQKSRNVGIAKPLLTYKPGTDSYNFNFEDIEGKKVSMASLKGKVVLIDTWATWCGPCRAEIPYLKKLEEEMKGKDVQIVSISTDAVKDKEKWKKMIKDENLGGLQLFAGGPDNDFSKFYKINTIPRFLVFDKQGKIVTIDSPRPSNAALKDLLEKTLAK